MDETLMVEKLHWNISIYTQVISKWFFYTDLFIVYTDFVYSNFHNGQIDLIFWLAGQNALKIIAASFNQKLFL